MGQKLTIKVKAVVKKNGTHNGVMVHKSSSVNTNSNNSSNLIDLLKEKVSNIINKYK